MTDARVTFLGTGTSTGVPAIGCRCETCRSSDPRDKRLRTSIYVEVVDGPAILVDTATDLRQQALTHDITRVDAILFTHSHVDHILGLDEVRRFNAIKGGAIAAYADARTAKDLRRVFDYVFTPPEQKGGGIPMIDLQVIDGPFDVQGVRVVPITIHHGRREILAFRLGSFAYATDCSGIPESSYPLFADLDILVIDALRHRPHPTHFNVAEALDAIARIHPRRALLTHMCHDLRHAATNAQLPSHVELAYDGQQLTVKI